MLLAGKLGVLFRRDLPAFLDFALHQRALVEGLGFAHLSEYPHTLDHPAGKDTQR